MKSMTGMSSDSKFIMTDNELSFKRNHFFARVESLDNPVKCKEILKTVIPAGWDSRYALSSLWKMLGKHFSGQTQRRLLGRMDAALFC